MFNWFVWHGIGQVVWSHVGQCLSNGFWLIRQIVWLL
jgi:hypothetical protein